MTAALKWLVKISLNFAMSSGLVRPVKTPVGRVAPNQNSCRTCSTVTFAPAAAWITSVPMRNFAMEASNGSAANRAEAPDSRKSGSTAFRSLITYSLDHRGSPVVGRYYGLLRCTAVQTVIYPPARRRGVRPGSARTGLQNALLVVGGGVSRFSKAARSASIPLRRDDYCWSPQFSDQGPRLLLCDCR